MYLIRIKHVQIKIHLCSFWTVHNIPDNQWWAKLLRLLTVIGESGSRLFEQILGPLKQRHHQRKKIFNNIFFQCIVLDYMHVFARYSLKGPLENING